MKKLIYLILIVFSFSMADKGYARENRLSIWAGYSYGNEVSAVPGETPTKVYLTGFNATLKNLGTEKSKSAISFGLDYRVFRNLWIGATVTTGGCTKDLSILNGVTYTDPDASTSYKSTSFMLNIKWAWLKVNKFGFYTRAGFGASTFSDYKFEVLKELFVDRGYELVIKTPRDTSSKFAWQASILGVEWRPVKWVAAFAEGGLGNQGNLLAGLRVYVL